LGGGSLANVAVGKAVAEGKRLPPSLFSRGGNMLQVLSIIGQTILILIGMGLVFSLILFNLAGVRALRKLGQELRDSNLPESDLIIPKPFDQNTTGNASRSA
jgi:hypothetical protein